MRSLKITLVLASGLLLSSLAQAHPKLLSSSPAEGADGAAPGKIELHFSENLLTQFSGAKLVMTHPFQGLFVLAALITLSVET
jgi:methionine-rich copper-binding protein CopC